MRLLNAFSAAVAFAVLSACGSSPSPPTAPGPVPSSTPSPPSFPGDLSGVWHGYLDTTRCSVGPASTTCDAARTAQFILRATAGGPGYVGVFESPDALSWVDAVDVAGVVQPDGSVVFTGTRPPLPGSSIGVEVRRLLVRRDPDAGLTGEVDVWKSGSTGASDHLSGRVLSASYQPFASLPGQSVAGTWSGVALIRGCTGYCPLYQDPGDGVYIRSMVLGQNGGRVSGNLQLSVFSCSGCSLPVIGSTSGAQVSLSSPLVSRADVSGDRTLHLESFSGTIDDLGRISGRFVYASDSRIAIAPFNVSYRIECELLWLKRD